MTLLSAIKSMLGLGDGDRRTEGTAVPVERGRQAGTERSDADDDAETGRGAVDASSESAVKTEPSADAGPDEGGSEAVDTISGIGPAYAERLGAAGVETVAELADADAAELAAATDIAEGRIAGWIEQARSG